MILKLRQGMARDESGFTLVELLVVMLILGLLAAIAIPAFFNQRNKAKDADAKSSVRTAETAMETFATDNNGKYTGVAVADEQRGYEPHPSRRRDRQHLHGSGEVDLAEREPVPDLACR